MYCSNCGSSVNDKLKYCNSCGERIGRDEDKEGTPGKMLDKVLTTLFLIVLFGFGILIGLVGVLKGNDTPNDVVTIIVIVYLMAVFGICFTLLRQVPKLIDAKLNRTSSASPDFISPQQLNPRTTAQLADYQQPASVTEHTTRTLEGVPIKRGGDLS
ncbi:MAG: hypothetical protein ABI878_07905 [Acidobacteriota bacterium]